MSSTELATKEVLDSFDAVWSRLKEKGQLTPRLTISQLEAELDSNQTQTVRRILALDPQDYDVRTPFIGLEPVPDELVAVTDQKYTVGGQTRTVGEKLVPRHVYDAFLKMNKAFMVKHPDRILLIGSAYRSPASQVITFINWCSSAYGGDIGKTIRHASPPAYSQHTNATKTAIDILNVDGLPTTEHPEGFKDTLEYRWLSVNANQFGFFESWPEGNMYGMRAEPWHWQYLGTS